MPQDSAEAVKTKKPSDSAFKQQRLPAWQPILTAGTVLPTFFVIGIAFIPVGIGLVYFSDVVKEHVVTYTDCNSTIMSTGGREWTEHEPCIDIILKEDEKCTCRIKFNLTDNFKGDVYMYYGLSNYYQNHRRYVKSRDDNQLLGKLDLTPSTDCMPFAFNNESKPIAPCGAIANSMFNDVLTLYRESESGIFEPVPLLRTGIAWESDKKIKFRNPEGNLTVAFKDFARPKAWKKEIWQLDPEDDDNNGFQNEDLIVWMRTAALPTFRKLYRRLNRESNVNGYRDGLIKGSYMLEVEYNYNVSAFGGSKRMILSTTSLMGGKNSFLGIAYIVVGCVCLLLGIALLFIHIKCGKSTSEMINVNPRTPYQ